MIPSTDPRLTAYALGEMDAAERAAFEAELMKSDESQKHVAELSSAAELLRAELEKSAPDALVAAQKKKIEAEAVKPAAKKVTNVVPLGPSLARRALYVAGPLAVAAGLLGVLWTMNSSNNKEAADYGGAEGKSSAAARATGGPMTNRRYAPAGTAAATGTAQVMASAATEPADMNKDAKQPSEVGPDAGTPSIPANEPLPENPFVETAQDPKSTFSIDVDTASYSMIRRLLEGGQMPQPGLVRIEEMVNYFHYSYPEPDDAAFGVTADTSSAPWAPSHRLLRIGLKGKTVQMAKRPSSNLVFLIDSSGSMQGADRLGLLKKGFQMLVEQLDERDTVSIVAYAGSSGLVLAPTHGNEKQKILDAIEKLKAGGSTNGGQGIQLAYDTAKGAFVEGGTNRVILATDGDFNVGVTNRGELQKLIEDKAKSGVFLSVLGFGLGNTRDSTMEMLADKGNGNYAYIDGMDEARKVFVEQASGTLITIAKDVKIQISFDPKFVQSFRLIGYENRVLSHQDFADDKKDAGEIGAGHTVTALYEIVTKSGTPATAHLADIALRYKQPDGVTSKLVETSVNDKATAFADASTDFRFAATVAGFGMMLRHSAHKGDLSYGALIKLANDSVGDDKEGHRKQFVTMVEKAARLSDR